MKKDITTINNDVNIHNEGETVSSDVRQPWSGDLDELELSRPGGLLVAALVRCANERHMKLKKMAKELGVTYSYIERLRQGIHPVKQIGDKFSIACARYLLVPRITVLMLIGRISAADLLETDNMMAVEVSKAFRFVCDDMNWGHFVTPELRRVDEISQFGVVRLYEAATGKVLMDKALDCQSLATQLAKMGQIQASRASIVHEHGLKKAAAIARRVTMEVA